MTKFLSSKKQIVGHDHTGVEGSVIAMHGVSECLSHCVFSLHYKGPNLCLTCGCNKAKHTFFPRLCLCRA